MTRNLSVLSRVSCLAIAAVLTAGAAAQSFQGTPSVSSGDVGISEGPGTTNVFVNSSQAVFDWTPDDNAEGNFGAINFQPSGTTATFSGSSDFAVLNRLNVADDTRIVALNGTINSLVGGQTGGSVFFYSPSGFVLTGSSIINVGSLVLSARPITVTDGSFINNGVVEFGAAVDPFGNSVNPNAAINIVSDVNGTSQINSSGFGSYVALVAPTILHQGDIRTDGTAALVAAETATMTIDPFGLFDIQVTIGTDVDQGIHVDGGTIGRNSEAISSDNIHRAYLIAVAKNDAVTMLINNGAEIGFEIGTSASVEDNAVVISGGYNVDNGNHDFRSGVSNVPLTITNASLSSHVDAQVTGGAAINSGQGALSFGGDLSIIGGETTTTGGNVLIDGMNGNALTIGGDLYARAFRQNADGSQTGLITRLGASGGSTVTIGGSVTLDSDSFGTQIGEFLETGTNAIGGNAQVNIGANSTLNVTGSVNVHADGYGGHSLGISGNGIGGQALVMSIGSNATVTVGGSVSASASGFGGTYIECSSCGVIGGNGVGGNASVHTNVGSGNSLEIAGDMTILASGHGGAGDGQAGGGFGGTANLGASDNSSLTVGADTEVDASGFGGGGEENQGGLGRGGTARIGTNTGGSIELTGPVFVTADGEGGSSFTLGGTGTGGVAQISAFLGTIHAFNNVSVSAHSSGGFAFGSGTGGDGLADIETAITPVMTEASLFAGGGTLTVDGLTVVSAGATGGNGGFDGGDGGNAVAAGVDGMVSGGAVIHAGNSDAGPSVIQLGGVTVSAEASGGAGGDGQGGIDGSDGGNGGSATGGKAVMTAAAGSGDLTAGAVIISASAVGGDGGSGGGGDGGNGGDGGDGGSATGGFVNIGSESGNTNFAQASNDGVATYASILSFTRATGGDGGNAGFGTIAGVAGNGGDAIGGNNVLLVRGSTVNVGQVDLDASAFGGNGGLDTNESFEGIGGYAVTGSVGVLATNRFTLPDQRGTLNAGAITGTNTAQGGLGATNGGSYTVGGGAFFEVINSDVTADSVNLVVGAEGIDPSATETFASRFAIVEGTVDIANGFNIQTPGRVSVHVDQPDPVSALTAASFTISADTFVHDETRPLPGDIGIISADTIGLSTGGDLIVDAHLASTNSLSLTAPGLVDIEDASSGGDILGGAGTSFTAGTLTAAGLISVSATDDVNLVLVNAGSDITILSFLGDINANGMSSSDGSIFLDGETSIATGPLTAAVDITAFSPGSISAGDITAGGAVLMFAGPLIDVGEVSAGEFIDLNADTILGGDMTAIGYIDLFAGGLDTINVGDLSGAGVYLTSIGDITTGTINSTLDVDAQSFDGSITTLAITAATNVALDATSSITTGNIGAGDQILVDAGQNISLGNLATDLDVDLIAGGSAVFGDATVGTEFDFDVGGNVTGGDIVAGVEIGGEGAGGNVTLGNLTAGFGEGIDEDTFSVGFTAGGSITVGDVNGAQRVGFAALGDLTTGDIQTGWDFMALVGGDISTGGITTDAEGQLYLANASMYLDATDGGVLDFDPEVVLALDPVATGGSINIGGPVDTSWLRAAAGDDFSALAITASSDIDVSAGGTITVGGAWNSGGDVELISNDIDIGASGSVSGGDLSLVSTNATQTVVGDGVPGGGYQLSEAEYNRLNSNDINVIADTSLGAAPRMLIGNLSVDASAIEGAADYEFVTFDSESESVEGSIRILGEMIFTDMGVEDSVTFTTNTFELDATTGLLSLENAAGGLGGTLFLDAAQIHVAEGDILDQLAEDPQYDGYQDDLNAPAEVERPDGVIRAGSIEIEFADGGESQLNTLYVQNTGTADAPAGFLVGQAALFGEGNEVTPPPGSIDVVINGQIVTEGGTLTGIEVRDALVEAEGDLTPFTENSTINGCLLTGPCEVGPPEPPFPPGFNPAGPGIQDEVTLIDDEILPPPEFGNEDVIDDNDEDTEDDSPITPPSPLFDTSELGDAGGTVAPDAGTPMRSTPGLTDTGDIDDPVSGSGNPALMESSPPAKKEQQQ